MLHIFSSLVLVVYSSCTLLVWADTKLAGKEPTKPLTQEEMVQQAREPERNAGIKHKN